MEFIHTFMEINPSTLKVEERELDTRDIMYFQQLDEKELLADGTMHTVCVLNMANGVHIKVSGSIDDLMKFLG